MVHFIDGRIADDAINPNPATGAPVAPMEKEAA